MYKHISKSHIFQLSKGLKAVKCLVLLYFVMVDVESNAQMTLVVHPQPPGYTTLETREKHDLKIDANGNKWMGFKKIGLGRYDGTNWLMFDSINDGLPSNEIFSIDVSIPNEIWIGTLHGASHFNSFSWNNYDTQNSGLPDNRVNAVLSVGSLTWMGTNSGLVKYDGGNWTIYNTANSGLLNDTVLVLKANANGDLRIGTQAGVSMFDGNSWTNFNAINSIIPTYPVFDLETDNYGNTWVSSLGVFMITANGMVKNFQGDLYQEEFPIVPVSKNIFAKDNTGKIYIRILPLHLFRFDNLSYEKLMLPSFMVGTAAAGYKMSIDQNNWLWYTSKRDAGTSSFQSFDLNSYQPVPGNFAVSFDNYKNLDINNVKSLMLNRGDMHWDLSYPKYEVPKGSGKHSVFTSALWIGGLDAGGNIHLAAQTYRQSGVDYWPGPIDGISIPFDSSSCNHYDVIWKVSKWQVEEFKNKFADGSVTNGTYLVNPTFLSWPAKGNNFVVDDKAPFFDFNNDNVYNPYDGDYPLIKGDQMLFWMFNDSLAPHTESGGPKLGIEVHASAYAYNCSGIADSNTVLNHTTLYHYRILNRSSNDYNGMYMGLWCDNDLGNASDDYVGCDTTLAAGFVWNGDNNDENINGYGLNPPMQNIVVLRGTLADAADGIDNDLDSFVDEPGERTSMNHFMYYNSVNNSPVGNPVNYNHFYTYMKSIWMDGLHLTFGGDGRDVGSPPTNFMFSGTPYGSGWTESNVGNTPEDRRFLLSSGPVSFASNGELTIDFAYVFTRDSLNPNGLTTSVARNIADVQRVRNWFDNDNFPSCEVYLVGTSESSINENKIVVYPNPASNFLFVSGFEFSNTLKCFSIRDMTGRLIQKGICSNGIIHLDGMKNGIYFLFIEDGSANKWVKFVKSEP